MHQTLLTAQGKKSLPVLVPTRVFGISSLHVKMQPRRQVLLERVLRPASSQATALDTQSAQPTQGPQFFWQLPSAEGTQIGHSHGMQISYNI